MGAFAAAIAYWSIGYWEPVLSFRVLEMDLSTSLVGVYFAMQGFTYSIFAPLI